MLVVWVETEGIKRNQGLRESNRETLWLESQVVHDLSHEIMIFHFLTWSKSLVVLNLNHIVYDSNHNFFLDYNHGLNHRNRFSYVTDLDPNYFSTWLKSHMCSWLESNIFFSPFLCKISRTYKSFFSLKYFTMLENTYLHYWFENPETTCSFIFQKSFGSFVNTCKQFLSSST